MVVSTKLEYLKKCYKEDVKKAREKFEYNVMEYLEMLGLNKKVVRKRDGKIGWLAFNNSSELCFYPRINDGTTSRNSSGWFLLETVINEFEPYRGDEE